MSERQTKTENQKCLAKLAKLALSIFHSLTLDMLNNFCFHAYAPKSLSHSFTLSFTHSGHAEQFWFIAENCNAFFLPQQHHHPIP